MTEEWVVLRAIWSLRRSRRNVTVHTITWQCGLSESTVDRVLGRLDALRRVVWSMDGRGWALVKPAFEGIQGPEWARIFAAVTMPEDGQ
jgi:hypothetical protein